jgi:hypothetical protein
MVCNVMMWGRPKSPVITWSSVIIYTVCVTSLVCMAYPTSWETATLGDTVGKDPGLLFGHGKLIISVIAVAVSSDWLKAQLTANACHKWPITR